MIPEIGTRVSTAQENMNNIENECESALAGLFKKVTDKQNRLDNYLGQWIPTSKPLFTLPEKFVPNRHTPYVYKQISIPKDRLQIDFSAWENIILQDMNDKKKEDKKMGFNFKTTANVELYDALGKVIGTLAKDITVDVTSIPLPAGTVFYKKVYARKLSGRGAAGYRSAIIKLVSTGEGKCVLTLNNRDFKCRFASANITNITLFSKIEARVAGTGKTNKKGLWIDYKYVEHVRRRELNTSDLVKWEFYSSNAPYFKYVYGLPVVPDSYDNNETVCAAGIHGYLSAAGAEAYNL